MAFDTETEMHTLDRRKRGQQDRKKSRRKKKTAIRMGNVVNVGIIKHRNARRFSFL